WSRSRRAPLYPRPRASRLRRCSDPNNAYRYSTRRHCN
ncbi:MAG: hypothetical protein AVDCRST_MAG88-3539, partial [uncultured Thermomicrobiales bacterium]